MNYARALFLVIVSIMYMGSLSGCTAVGVATGAGATLGIAAAKEGGISGAATDLRIKANILDFWFQYDLETFAKLNLDVDQGRVLITGVVQNPEHRLEAVRLAWQVPGVKQVINEIRLADDDGIPGYVRDKWISTRLRSALLFDREVQSINYSVETVQGTVYLMGIARSEQELNRVMDIARTIPNVREVVSYVKRVGEPVEAVPENGVSPDAPVAPAPDSYAPAPDSYAPPGPGMSDSVESAPLPP